MEIIFTNDKSHTIYVPDINETYHSRNGAIEEAEHVFIKSGLADYCETTGNHDIKIFELGFGTGLNTLLSCIAAEKMKISINYTAIEKIPLPLEIIEKLNFPSLVSYSNAQQLFHSLHHTLWEKEKAITQNFTLTKLESDIISYKAIDHTFDIIYFDAFAPGKQEQIWQEDVLQKMCNILISGGVFVTYCAKGVVRRTMEKCGLKVERLPGPPGKREMLRGIKQ